MWLIIQVVDVIAKRQNIVNSMREKCQMKTTVDASLDQPPIHKEVVMKKVGVLKFACWKVFFLQLVV